MRVMLTMPVKVPAGWVVETPTDAEGRALIAQGAGVEAPAPEANPEDAEETPTPPEPKGRRAK